MILTFLKEADAGTPINQVRKTEAISTRTFYRWRAHDGGLTAAAPHERNDLLRKTIRPRALVEALLRKIDDGSGVSPPPAQHVSRREPGAGRLGSVRDRR